MSVRLLQSPPKATGQEPSNPVSLRAKWETRLRLSLGVFLNRRRVPGVIQPLDFEDPLTGTRLEIRVTPLFTIVQINGRDFYFRRLSGDFDGTGA